MARALKIPPEPMTARQKAYLEWLCERAGEPFDATLSKTRAVKRIAALREKLKEPMTPRQVEYLRALSAEAGEPLNMTLSKAQAAERINALIQKVSLDRSFNF